MYNDPDDTKRMTEELRLYGSSDLNTVKAIKDRFKALAEFEADNLRGLSLVDLNRRFGRSARAFNTTVRELAIEVINDDTSGVIMVTNPADGRVYVTTRNFWGDVNGVEPEYRAGALEGFYTRSKRG